MEPVSAVSQQPPGWETMSPKTIASQRLVYRELTLGDATYILHHRNRNGIIFRRHTIAAKFSTVFFVGRISEYDDGDRYSLLSQDFHIFCTAFSLRNFLGETNHVFYITVTVTIAFVYSSEFNLYSCYRFAYCITFQEFNM